MTIYAEAELFVSSFPKIETMEAIDEKTCRGIKDLNVAERDGVIRIFGQSNTFYVKQLASETVSQLHPEFSVLNQIEVI